MSASSKFFQVTETYFRTEMGILYPGVPIMFENASKKYPNNGHWVKFHILTGKSFPASLGRRKVKRTVEVIHASVFAPEGVGAGMSREIGDAIAAMFEFRSFSIEGATHTIKYRAAIVKGAEDPVSGLHKTIVTIDGWRDEPHTTPG